MRFKIRCPLTFLFNLSRDLSACLAKYLISLRIFTIDKSIASSLGISRVLFRGCCVCFEILWKAQRIVVYDAQANDAMSIHNTLSWAICPYIQRLRRGERDNIYYLIFTTVEFSSVSIISQDESLCIKYSSHLHLMHSTKHQKYPVPSDIAIQKVQLALLLELHVQLLVHRVPQLVTWHHVYTCICLQGSLQLSIVITQLLLLYA